MYLYDKLEFIDVRAYIKYFVLHGMKDQQKEQTYSLQQQRKRKRKKQKSMPLTKQTNITKKNHNLSYCQQITFYYLWKVCFLSLQHLRNEISTHSKTVTMLNTGYPNCFNSLFIVDTLNYILLHPISFSLHLQNQYYL